MCSSHHHQVRYSLVRVRETKITQESRGEEGRGEKRRAGQSGLTLATAASSVSTEELTCRYQSVFAGFKLMLMLLKTCLVYSTHDTLLIHNKAF